MRLVGHVALLAFGYRGVETWLIMGYGVYEGWDMAISVLGNMGGWAYAGSRLPSCSEASPI
jgi:hypothetical protein